MKIYSGKFIVCLLSLFILSATAFAQTTAFNFQGRLNDGGSAANSNYDFQFKLFDALAGGAQVGATNNKPNLQVIGGVFSAVLDFGANAFLGGENRFLEISVRPAGSPNAHVILGARQQILAVPFTIRAKSAESADFANTASLAFDAETFGGVSPLGYARIGQSNSGNFIVNGNTEVSGVLTTNSLSVTQTANVGGNATVNGNATVVGTSNLNGNVVQPAASNGMAKAMIYVAGFGGPGAFIRRCYNGVTGSSSGNCGFTLTEPLGDVGVYLINFGFPVNNRFVVATSEYAGSATSSQNSVPQFKFLDTTTIEFFMTRISSPEDTRPSDFMVMVF